MRSADDGDTMTQQKKRKSTSQGYSGALAEPLKPQRQYRTRHFRRRRSRPPAVNGSGETIPRPAPADNSRSALRWRPEYDQKLPLLLDHFGIPRDDTNRWQRLALYLAVAHVPGFQVRVHRKKGRPCAMASQDELKLYERFCALRRNGQSDRNAARLMVKELRQPGHPTASDAAILRRMQRHEQKSRESAALIANFLSGFGVEHNSV